MIDPTDIPNADEALARRVIATARVIAPCLDSLEGRARLDALAILGAVAAEMPAPGSARERSQRLGDVSVTYWGQSAWTEQDKAALRALCADSTNVGMPRGVFPPPGGIARIWPEG